MKANSLIILVLLTIMKYSSLMAAQPTVVISSTEPNPTNASSFEVTITFSEAVDGFEVGDIVVANCTLSGFNPTANPVFTVSVTPTSNGLLTVGVPASVCTATTGGDNNQASPTFSRMYDIQSPTVAITSTETSPTNASPIPISITFNESVTGFAIEDISVTNGSASNLSGSGASYTANITPSGQGSVSVDISAGVATDGAGNGNAAAPTFSVTYDSQSPTVAITSTETSPTNATPIPISITFNESVTGFAIEDISVTNGSASNLSGSGANYTADITASIAGAVKVDIAVGAVTDAAGNGNNAAPQFSIDFDNVGPSVTITSTANSLTNVSPIPITITFSKLVTGFVLEDISVTNGTASGFSGSGTTYTASITPSAQGLVTVNVIANVAYDNVSNGNTAADPLSITYDSNPPTVLSVSVPASNTYGLGENLDFTVNYSESVEVTGTPYFTIDLYSGNNKHVNYVSGSGTSALVFRYTVQSGDYDGNGVSVDNLIILPTGDAIDDLAGNAADLELNGVASTSGVKVDAVAPVVQSVGVPADGCYRAGEVLSFTVVYDKSVTVLGAPYLNVVLNTGGTVKAFYSTGSGSTSLVFKYTVVSGNLDTDGIVLGSSIVLNSGDIYRGSQDANLALNNIASTTGVLVDAVAPAISSTVVSAGNFGIGSVIPVTITADANNYTADGSVLVNGESAVFANMGDNTYRVFYTVNASSTNRNAVSSLPISISLKDNADNITSTASASVSGGTLSINTKPTVRITGSTTKCDYPWQKVPITFTFTGIKPYTFTYNDGTSDHTVTNHNADTYTIDVVSGTFTLVSLTDNTGNTTTEALENATITINAVTTPVFNVTASPYNVTEVKDELSKYVIPTGGTFWGNGVGTDGYFYPSLIDVSGGAVTCNLKYSYTNGFGCKDTVTYDVIVRNESVYFNGLSTFYCVNASSEVDTITVEGLGTVTSESFTIPGTTPNIEWRVIPDHRIIIDPKLFTAGSYSLNYSYTENDKFYAIIDNFDIVKPSTTLDFGTLEASYCGNDAEVTLIAANNYHEAVKGHFSGPAGFSTPENSSLGTFSPAGAPKDQDLVISYYYETKEGCFSPVVEKHTMVYPVPDVHFTLRDNYNYDETPIDLGGTPEGGSFYGEIIELNKTLKPSLISQAHLGQNIDITYSYTDATSGCVGSAVVPTKVYRAEAPISNLESVYCYDNLTFDISCNPGIGVNFVFSSKKNALIQKDTHTASYSLAAAGEGADTVWYRYSIGTTPYEIAKAVYIDSIGDISLNIGTDFCNNADPLLIVGQHREMVGANEYSYTGSSAAFQGNAIFATFSPLQETPGDYSIKYKFTTERGCFKEIINSISVNPVSEVSFKAIGSCPGINQEIPFENSSTEPVGSTINWEWSFEGNKVYEKSPKYVFTTAGLKTVSLKATTDKGCLSESSVNMTIGYNANADFKWDRECFSDDFILFTDNSSGGSVASYTWKYNEVPLSNEQNFKYKFPEVGNYDLELVIETAEGCLDSITKRIPVQKFIDFSSSKVYLDNFDGATQDWVAKGLSDSDYSSWTFGTPTGTYFNSAASGATSWYTGTGLANQVKESSQVLSPCFDLRGLEKPMVKLNIWSAPEEGRDGAVLQYSTDGGITWLSTNVVGAAGEGVNWYDPINISSKPAGQSAGWSRSNPQGGWVTARHNLDMIKDSANVRFRIVYANEAININPFNGFAFDDFWIGDRQQLVLNEVFTNVHDDYDAANLMLKQFGEEKGGDLISIHYHYSFPEGDPFYGFYTAGPTSRGFYYGVGSIPSVYSNGVNPYSLLTENDIKAYKKTVDIETLQDPMLSFGAISGVVGKLSVSITANSDLSGKNLVLYAALVKDSIPAPSGKYYYNVLRRLYPSPSGVLLPTSDWTLGQTREQTVDVPLESSAEVVDAKLVLFVQDGNTNHVYQAATYSNLQSVVSVPQNSSFVAVDLYPNPASEFVVVESPSAIEQLMVYNMGGRMMMMMNPNRERHSFAVHNLESGVYIVKGTTRDGVFVKRFVKH
ncbi:MAG: T9SS type A sorting domain-containing protein [Bacteroidales bacterium]|nr:T9SS type A sorting domain-containing protein [Bacteroidales bacterium]